MTPDVEVITDVDVSKSGRTLTTKRPRVVVRIAMMAVITVGLMVAPSGGASVADAVAVPATVPSTSDVPNDFMDLERDLTQCISSNPLPGCGREPTSPGDRGGWQQFLLFGIMMSGIGIIFWRIVRSIRARDQVTPPSEKVSP